jgi:hypothetical protein
MKPTATFSGPPKGDKYMELIHFFWSPTGGNVILAVPMGEEAFRSEQELVPPGTLPYEPRRMRYQTSRSAVDLFAPDGQQVAMVDLDELDKQVELVKGQPNVIELGSVTMRIEPTKLIPGSTFIATPRKLTSTLNIGGGGPHIHEYTVHAAFDGSRLSAELRQTSGSLRNKNLPAPISGLDNSEEIVIVIPSETLKFSATLDAPLTSVTLLGRLTLRDHC